METVNYGKCNNALPRLGLFSFRLADLRCMGESIRAASETCSTTIIHRPNVGI